MSGCNNAAGYSASDCFHSDCEMHEAVFMETEQEEKTGLAWQGATSSPSPQYDWDENTSLKCCFIVYVKNL